MTQDIGSGNHKRPSSADIETAEKMAVMRERLANAKARDEEIMRTLSAIQKEQAQTNILLALGNQRFDAIEASHKSFKEDTTTRLDAIESSANKRIEALEADKRGPVAIVLSVLSALGSGATAWFR